MATKTLMTAEEFAHISVGETEDFELVDGELVAISNGAPIHALVRDSTTVLVRSYLEKSPVGGALAMMDCRISSDTVRRPDFSIFLGERWSQLDLRSTQVPYAPDIAVEVLSDNEHMIDVSRKVREYQSAGSIEVWLLDEANGELQVRTQSGIRLLKLNDVLDSPLLPGFAVKVGDLLSV